MMVSMSSTVDWQVALLDLLNTTPVIDGQTVDQLADGRRAWLRAHGAAEERTSTPCGRCATTCNASYGWKPTRPSSRRYLTDVRRVPDIGPDGVAWSLEADWPARIVLAWGEVERDMPGRLRPCANEDCRLFLLDHSRAGTARWCSMSGCGNRMKARRHYSKTRRD